MLQGHYEDSMKGKLESSVNDNSKYKATVEDLRFHITEK